MPVKGENHAVVARGHLGNLFRKHLASTYIQIPGRIKEISLYIYNNKNLLGSFSLICALTTALDKSCKRSAFKSFFHNTILS